MNLKGCTSEEYIDNGHIRADFWPNIEVFGAPCEDTLEAPYEYFLGEFLKKPLKRPRAGVELGMPIEDTLKVMEIMLKTMMN